MIRSKKISLILLTALFSINTARYTYAVVNDQSTPVTGNTASVSTIPDPSNTSQAAATTYASEQRNLVFDNNSDVIQNVTIPQEVKNPTIVIERNKLIIDKLTIDKKTNNKPLFIFQCPATLILNANDVKNIERIDLQNTASSIIINNTDKKNNEIEDLINPSYTTTNTQLPRAQSTTSLLNPFETGSDSTMKRSTSAFSLSKYDNNFDLSILSTEHSSYSIMRNSNNGTIHVVGKSKTDNILNLSSDVHLYGQVDLNHLVNTKPTLETNQTHGKAHTITIHASPSNKGGLEPGKLTIRSVVMANIQTKDNSELIAEGNDANIVFHQLGAPEAEYIKISVKDKSKLAFQFDNTVDGQQHVNMYNNIIADPSSKGLVRKSSATLHFFDPGNSSSITYNMYGYIGTSNNYFPQILLHEKSNLSVKDGIYARRIKLSLSEKNKGTSSTSGAASQLPMPDANTPQSTIFFNRYNYIKHLETDKANHGTVVIRGKYNEARENPRFFSTFQGDIGTAEAPLYAINFQEQNTPRGKQSYSTFTIHSRQEKEYNSIFLANGLNFANENDELEIKGKYKITGNIQWQNCDSKTPHKFNDGMGHIKLTNNSQLDFAGNIGTTNKPIASIQLDKNAHFNNNYIKSSKSELSYHSKKILMGENSALNLSKVSLYTDIIPVESGNGEIKLQDVNFVGNIGTAAKNVKEVIIVSSDDKSAFNKIAGNVYTNNYHVKNYTMLVGNHTVRATTPEQTGTIKLGNHDIMVGKHKYTLEADKIDVKGINSKKVYYSPNKMPSKQYSIFYIGYDLNDDGTVKDQGQLIINGKLEDNKKIIVKVNHVNRKDDMIKHNANTKIIPIVGDLSDSVYICDDKCRWVKTNNGEFAFDGIVVPEKKKLRRIFKRSPETVDDVALAALVAEDIDPNIEAPDAEITKDTEHVDMDLIEVNESSNNDNDENAIGIFVSSNDDSVVDDDTEAEMPVIQADATTYQLLTQPEDTDEHVYHSAQYSDDNDNQLDNRNAIRDYDNNNKQVAFADHDAHRIHNGSRHHNVSKMRTQHAVANTLNTKIGIRLFNLSNTNTTVAGDAEVISAGSKIVRNRNIGVWADGFIGKVNFDSIQKDHSTSTSISGIMIGVDSHINDNLILGTAASWSSLDTKIGNNAYYSSDNSAFIFTGYGQLSFDVETNTISKPFVQGVVNIINYNIIPSTEINGNQAKGNKYSSNGFNGSIMFGYPLSFMENMPLMVVPMVGVRYSSLTTPSHNITYKYSNISKTTSYGESRHSLLEGVVGISLKYLQHVDVMTGSYSPYGDTYNIDTESVNIIPEAHIFGHLKMSDSISHATANTTSANGTASFLTYNDPLQLSGVGVDLPNGSLQLGAKVTVKVSRFEFGISGDVYWASNYSAYMGMLHVKANF